MSVQVRANGETMPVKAVVLDALRWMPHGGLPKEIAQGAQIPHRATVVLLRLLENDGKARRDGKRWYAR